MMTAKDIDPFAPLSAKPKDEGERLSRRAKEFGANAGSAASPDYMAGFGSAR